MSEIALRNRSLAKWLVVDIRNGVGDIRFVVGDVRNVVGDIRNFVGDIRKSQTYPQSIHRPIPFAEVRQVKPFLSWAIYGIWQTKLALAYLLRIGFCRG